MNIQELLNNSDIDLTLPQIKAFFLGCQLGKKPLSFTKSFEELTNKSLEKSMDLFNGLSSLWTDLEKNKNIELKNIFNKSSDFSTFLESSKEQLDYFLTGLGLAGTSADSTSDDFFKEVLEELEELVLDIEDYLLSDAQSKDETQALCEDLEMLWNEFLKIKI